MVISKGSIKVAGNGVWILIFDVNGQQQEMRLE